MQYVIIIRVTITLYLSANEYQVMNIKVIPSKENVKMCKRRCKFLFFLKLSVSQILDQPIPNILHCKISLQGGHRVNVRRYSESTGLPEDLTGVMASARDITGYAPPPYDHKINVWGGAGGGQTWQRINTYNGN